MSRRVHWLRTSLIAVFGIFVWILLFLVGLIVALGSDSGTRWVLSHISGLEIQQGQGSLFGRWQAQRLQWRGYGVAVDMDSPLLDWSPGCLLVLEVCVDELSIAQTDIVVLPAQEETESSPIQLPALILPLDLDIKSVQLGALTVNQNQIWDLASLEASGAGTAWYIHSLQYRLGEIDVRASGRVETRGDWPLAVNLTSQLPPPAGDHWLLNLALSGSARELNIQGSSEGYLGANVRGHVAPFEEHLPATLSLRAEHFLAADGLPETLILEDWQLDMTGNLADGFDTRSVASLPGTAGRISADLKGLLTTDGVTGMSLVMEAPDSGQASVVGELGWQSGLRADADVTLKAFPWYQLVPDMERPPVNLQQMEAHVGYENDRYQANVRASIEGPLGPTELDSRISGDLESVSLEALTIKTGAGNAEGQGRLTFADQLAWTLGLTLDRFNPGYWIPQLEASLNGELATEGGINENGELALQGNWALSGSWLSQDTVTQGVLSGHGEDWTVSDFSLVVGDNRVDGEGSWRQQIDAVVNLDLVDPAQLLPGLGGQLQGRLVASGTPAQPLGHLSISATALEWQGQVAAEQVSLSADLEEDLTVDANLQLQGLTAGGQSLGQVAAQLKGNPENHRLSVDLVQKELETHLELVGRWAEGWFGALSRGEIRLTEQNQAWTLDAPASITYRPSSILEVGSHCWRWLDSSVCAGDQVLWPKLAINYQLTDFPTEALGPVIPDTLRWQALVDGRLVVNMTDQGPDGQIRLSASASRFEVLVEEEWHSLAYDVFDVALGLKPEEADFSLDLSGPEIGRLTTHMALNPGQPDYPITGEFQLQGLDVAPLGVIADLEVLEGVINGEGTLAGPLKRPEITGNVVLSDARLLDSRIPIPMEALDLELQLKGRAADIEGHWQSHERSTGQVTGTFDWSEKPLLDLALSGKRLPFNYEPYASVELEPDLNLRYSDGGLAVRGRVAVPRGQVEIRGLPEQAVTVSSDEVIVGRDAEEPILRTLTMDVTVDVGSDQVTFSGFGVTGDLDGVLKLGDNLDARGILQLQDGNFKAFGQELELHRARLVFVGSLTEPYLDIEAVREVGDVIAGLRLTGPVSGPSTEVFSEPPMSQPNALSYVILGRPLQTEGDQGQVGQAALALGLAQASGVTEKFGEELGIQQLTLGTEGSGEDASVVASGYITNELSIRYGVGLFDPISTVALRYDLGRFFYLEAASGLAASLDLFYTRNF